MPVFDDLAILHAIQIERLKIDGLAIAPDVLELAGEMSAKVQMDRCPIAGHPGPADDPLADGERIFGQSVWFDNQTRD